MDNNSLNLKLFGKNLDDLKIISAYLQDSIVLVKDIVYLQSNSTFLMMVNRFMWEDAERGIFRNNKRVRCALKFERVQKAISKNINQKNKNRALELLTIKSNLRNDNTYEIRFIFSGNSIISIYTEEIDILLDDQGEPWAVTSAPQHKL
tara:strand:+ start:88 stop:534 length:447 start_codon:yes stop_codon:yes gene_type:complete